MTGFLSGIFIGFLLGAAFMALLVITRERGSE